MMNLLKKGFGRVVIEGSRHNKKQNRWMRVLLYIAGPATFILCLFLQLTETREDFFYQWAGWGLAFAALFSMFGAYLWDKGYRHRDKITEEDYASLGYKPMSASQLGWCIVIGVAVTNLNKYYLHWF